MENILTCRVLTRPGKKWIMWPSYGKKEVSTIQGKNIIKYAYAHGVWRLSRNKKPSISLKPDLIPYNHPFVHDPKTSFILSKSCIEIGYGWHDYRAKLMTDSVDFIPECIILNFLSICACRIIFNGTKSYAKSEGEIGQLATELFTEEPKFSDEVFTYLKDNFFFNPENTASLVEMANSIILAISFAD